MDSTTERPPWAGPDYGKPAPTKEQKEAYLRRHGWTDYYGNSWIKKEWIGKLPYDRMATSLDDAFEREHGLRPFEPIDAPAE